RIRRRRPIAPRTMLRSFSRPGRPGCWYEVGTRRRREGSVIRAAIFDLDGLLIDSEPLWRAVEVEVFRGVGVPLTEEMCRQTTGLRVDAVVEWWHARHPWRAPAPAAVAARIVDRMVEAIAGA